MEPTSSPMFESRTLILATVYGTLGFHLVRGAITRPCLETIWYATLAERGRVVIKKGDIYALVFVLGEGGDKLKLHRFNLGKLECTA